MNIYKIKILFLVTMILTMGMYAIAQSNSYLIIPQPKNIAVGTQPSNLYSINIPMTSGLDSQVVSNMFFDIPNVRITNTSANLNFKINDNLADEAYILEIKGDKIEIKAKKDKGWMYGLITLSQIIRQSGFPLIQMTINDEPKFAYRGMHLDVARHFFSLADVKKYLDYLASYKFNYFHWHLTDDQGWRIEIKKYPKLQEVAAYRDETLIGHYNDSPQRFDGKRYGGYYTQEEVKEVVAYANARKITVIPEIEMPGHAQAALAAYPELGCETKEYKSLRLLVSLSALVLAIDAGVFDTTFLSLFM